MISVTEQKSHRSIGHLLYMTKCGNKSRKRILYLVVIRKRTNYKISQNLLNLDSMRFGRGFYKIKASFRKLNSIHTDF